MTSGGDGNSKIGQEGSRNKEELEESGIAFTKKEAAKAKSKSKFKAKVGNPCLKSSASGGEATMKATATQHTATSELSVRPHGLEEWAGLSKDGRDLML
ncbi:unnamed protein product [Arabis nemorensis]|uniref:Uncharacterized protein n=1 Tax=Arabis nemorensis TaxID=586526 RepID=A0A565BFD9_9BRAS|nr:unnamed protein product [Arabis nemorensis]